MISEVNTGLFRLLDANCNRAREAMRVLEDYARFVADDASLSESLKRARHDLTQATASLVDPAIFARNTPGDVGTAHETASESRRVDLPHVLRAAGQRLGEALRAIEEFLKTLDPDAAAKVEAIRYRHYELERQIMSRVSRPGDLAKRLALYVLITESACRHDWRATAAAALRGGATALQLREKTLEGRELLSRARLLASMCREAGALFIVNDRVDVAVLCDADGVHVGQGDLSVQDARRLLGAEKIIGLSTHELAHARAGEAAGADYLGVGPVFRSPTKPREISPGLPYAREAAAAAKIPCVGIAGITLESAADVLATGVAGIALTSAITQASDVEAATRAFRELLRADLV